MKFNELDQKIKDGTLTESEIKTFADNSREYLNTISSINIQIRLWCFFYN